MAKLFARLAIVAIVASFWGATVDFAVAQAVPSRAPTAAVDVRPLPALQATAPQPAPFDVQKSTEAYLAHISGRARQRSDTYFEGKYFLNFLEAAYALAIAALLLWGRISSGMRDFAQTLTRSRFFQVPIYVGQYVGLTTVLALPLTIYEGYFREHAYGLSNQNFLQWSNDFIIAFLLTFVASIVVLTLIYAAIRATPRNWWIWGAAIWTAFLFVELVITPVLIAPLFNHYRELLDSPIKQEILTMARGNGIPADHVYEFDASRQSNRISANVSGFLGTTRISMTDNLMTKTSPAEIKAVLGHEMGHYVLNHPAILLTWIGLLALAGFAFVNWFFRELADIFGGNWDVRTIEDPAGLPILAAGATIFMLLSMPIHNTVVRTVEEQADMFGLNTARQPDAFAEVTLKLSTYRKLDPSPLEEFIFYDHPSGRTRIFGAMRWKAAPLNDPDIKSGPVSPQ